MTPKSAREKARLKTSGKIQGIAKKAAPELAAAKREGASPNSLYTASRNLQAAVTGGRMRSVGAVVPVRVPSLGQFTKTGLLKHDGHDHGPDLDPSYEKVPAPEITAEQKRRFRIYKLGVSAVKIGIETLHIVIPLLILTHYGSVTAVGGMVIGANLAGLTAGWLSSSLVDRWRPSRVLAATAFLQGAVILSIPLLYVLGSPLSLPIVMGLYIAHGGLHGIFDIARRAEMPHILGRHEGTLREYNGRLYIWREVAGIGGDAGVGLLAKSGGFLTSLWLHPLSYFFAGYQFLRLAATSDPVLKDIKRDKETMKTRFASLLDGARTVLSDPALRTAAFVNVPVLVIHQLFHTMLAAVYATKVLGNPLLAVVLVGAWNAGELASAWLLKRYGKRGGSFQWLRIGAATGLSAWAMWLWPTIWVAMPVAFLLAASTLSNELGLASFFQSRAEKRQVGAVTGFVYSLSTAASMLALFGMGRLFDLYDPLTGFLVIAIVLSAVSVFYLLSWRILRGLSRKLLNGFLSLFPH